MGSFCDWLSSVVEAALKKERPTKCAEEVVRPVFIRFVVSRPHASRDAPVWAVSPGDWSEPKGLAKRRSLLRGPTGFWERATDPEALRILGLEQPCSPWITVNQ